MEKTGRGAAAEPPYTDQEAAYLAQRGDEDAAAYLIAHYLPVLRRQARSICPVGMEWEDLLQEGLIGFLFAISRYDPQREAVFKTFASRCALNRMLTAMEAQGREKRAPKLPGFPLEEGERPIPSPGSDPEEIFIQRESLSRWREQLSTLLSPFEQAALKQYLSGYSYQEIALATNSTAKAVDNALQRVRRKLRTTLW